MKLKDIEGLELVDFGILAEMELEIDVEMLYVIISNPNINTSNKNLAQAIAKEFPVRVKP